MKEFVNKLVQHTANLLARVIVYGSFIGVVWWLFDEEVVQVYNYVIETLDKIF